MVLLAYPPTLLPGRQAEGSPLKSRLALRKGANDDEEPPMASASTSGPKSNSWLPKHDCVVADEIEAR